MEITDKMYDIHIVPRLERSSDTAHNAAFQVHWPGGMGKQLEDLWKGVEAAKLRWFHAHDGVIEVNEHIASITTQDGSYAYSHAIHAERLAVKDYLHAIEEFQAAVAPRAINAAGLTPREREVLTLIASGQSRKQIALTLGIRFTTVGTHRYNVQRKLNSGNSADLTRAAIRMGLIEP